MGGISKAEQIQGWMSYDELEWLANAACDSNLIYEVGCYKGRSTCALADNTPGVVCAIDPWNGPCYRMDDAIECMSDQFVYEQFCRNLRYYIINGKLRVFRTTFQDFDLKDKADFIFIDGDHRYEAIRHDLLKARDLVKPGGILSGHDYGRSYWPSVTKAVDELLPNVKVVNSIWYTNT